MLENIKAKIDLAIENYKGKFGFNFDTTLEVSSKNETILSQFLPNKLNFVVKFSYVKSLDAVLIQEKTSLETTENAEIEPHTFSSLNDKHKFTTVMYVADKE